MKPQPRLFLPLPEITPTCEISATLMSHSFGQFPDPSALLYPLHTFCELLSFLPIYYLALASFLSLPSLDLMSSVWTTLFLVPSLPCHYVLLEDLPGKPSTLDHMNSLCPGAEHYWEKNHTIQGIVVIRVIGSDLRWALKATRHSLTQWFSKFIQH